MPEGLVWVIGLADDSLDRLDPEATAALRSATVVVGGRRHLGRWSAWAGGGEGAAGGSPGRAEAVEISSGLDQVVAVVARRRQEPGASVCVLASGDPGFFGILRALLGTIDRRHLRVVPAPSSVSLAFARLGLPWDDAVVVSAHGRPLAAAVGVIRVSAKVAVLTSPDSPPEALGRALVAEGMALDLVAVCSRLGGPDESVRQLTLAELAAGTFDPLSVVVLVGPGGRPGLGWEAAGPSAVPVGPTLAWGRPDHAYAHRAGMITKSEVRAVVLAKLALPATGVLWDIGAGSASVAIECAGLCPRLTVLAVEQGHPEAATALANAGAHRVAIHLITGSAPAVLAGLPDPDRAFVGGGGLGVLEAVLARLRPGGRVVATFAALDRAAAAAERLGNLVQVGIDRGQRLPDGGWRLAAQNPVFVAWGPRADDTAPDPGPGPGAAAGGPP